VSPARVEEVVNVYKLSVGDNFYDSGVDFTTSGILRFQAAWVDMYSQGIFKKAPW
jgi:tartrate-resistant acid phosphatase type 5